jgi:hypothetical protein
MGVVAGYIEVEDLKAMYRELGMQVNDLDIKNMIAGIVTVRLRGVGRFLLRAYNFSALGALAHVRRS